MLTKPYTLLMSAVCSSVFFISNIRGYIPPINNPMMTDFAKFASPILEKINEFPIEHKLNLMHISYIGRQVFHTIGISQQTIIRLVEETEWSEIDYFNMIIFISSVYALYQNIETKEKIDKLSKIGILDRKTAHKSGIMFFVLFTVLFRDVENAI
jgi:hypothetical protein